MKRKIEISKNRRADQLPADLIKKIKRKKAKNIQNKN